MMNVMLREVCNKRYKCTKYYCIHIQKLCAYDIMRIYITYRCRHKVLRYDTNKHIKYDNYVYTICMPYLYNTGSLIVPLTLVISIFALKQYFCAYTSPLSMSLNALRLSSIEALRRVDSTIFMRSAYSVYGEEGGVRLCSI